MAYAKFPIQDTVEKVPLAIITRSQSHIIHLLVSARLSQKKKRAFKEGMLYFY